MPVPLQILASYTDSTGYFWFGLPFESLNPTTDYVNDDGLGNEIECWEM